MHDIILYMYRCSPSVFLFLFCGSPEDGILLFDFGALCEEFSCSWILFFNADFICALIMYLKIILQLNNNWLLFHNFL